MYYKLRFYMISGELYVYNEVYGHIYKIIEKTIYNNLALENIKPVVVQYLKEQGCMDENTSFEQISDCSSYVDIQELWFNNNSVENKIVYDYLCNKYYMNKCTVVFDNASCEKVNQVNELKKLVFENLYVKLDYIIKILFYDCKRKLSLSDIIYIKNVWLQCRNMNYNVNNLHAFSSSLLLNIVNKKNIFPCDWGLKKLYVQNGTLHRCKMCKEMDINVSEVGCILSVDELKKCKHCYARYICGGMCIEDKQFSTEICNIICEVIDFLIKMYIINELGNFIEV